MPASRHPQAVVSTAALAVLLFLMPGAAVEQPSVAALFDDTVVHDLHIEMHSGDWDRLRAHYLENTYYPADLHWNGHVVRNIGLRSRGSGSRDPHKPGLKVDFNEFVSGQTFAGLKALALDNFRQDPAMLKESLAMQLFTRAGIPAPRVSHARVFVNGHYHGLYGILEPIDEPFLLSRFGEDDGYLYEFEWGGEYRFEWLGADPRRYAGMFEAETHGSQPPELLYGTLVAFVNTATRATRDVWEQEMGRFVDFDHILTYLAVEQFLADHDGLAGDWGMNNFYLYRFAGSERFQFIPWDKDVWAREVDRSVYAGLEEHGLFAAALSRSHLRGRYEEALRRVAALADDRLEGDGRSWLEREITRLAGLIREAAHADPSKAWSNARFEEEVAWMTRFARLRSREVLEELR
jgi:spore coat protein CotH